MRLPPPAESCCAGRAAADLQSNQIDYSAVANGGPAVLAQLGRRLGGEGTLIGRASGTGAAASVRWTHVFQDRSSEFSGTLEGVITPRTCTPRFSPPAAHPCRSISR